jgi:hypothetical protein
MACAAPSYLQVMNSNHLTHGTALWTASVCTTHQYYAAAGIKLLRCSCQHVLPVTAATTHISHVTRCST